MVFWRHIAPGKTEPIDIVDCMYKSRLVVCRYVPGQVVGCTRREVAALSRMYLSTSGVPGGCTGRPCRWLVPPRSRTGYPAAKSQWVAPAGIPLTKVPPDIFKVSRVRYGRAIPSLPRPPHPGSKNVAPRLGGQPAQQNFPPFISHHSHRKLRSRRGQHPGLEEHVTFQRYIPNVDG